MDEEKDNIMEEIGNILAEQKSGGGSVQSSGTSESVSGGNTTGNETTSGHVVSESEKQILADRAKKIDPLPEYQIQPFDFSPYRDMWRREEERRKKKLQTNLSQQDLERRRNKYLAWTDFGKALGQLHGVGYAPVKEMDTRRALDSYAKLDALRKEYDAINADDSLSWIQKLAITSQLAHNEKELARYNARQKQNLDIDHWNQVAHNTTGGTISTKESETEKKVNRMWDAFNKIVTDNTKSTSIWSNVFKNPKYVEWYEGVKANANANKPITNIGRGIDYPITQSEAANIISEIRDVATAYNDKNRSMQQDASGEYYVSPNGMLIPKKFFSDEMEQTRNVLGTLMDKLGSKEDNNNQALIQLIHDFETAFGYGPGYGFQNYITNVRNGVVGAPEQPTTDDELGDNPPSVERENKAKQDSEVAPWRQK